MLLVITAIPAVKKVLKKLKTVFKKVEKKFLEKLKKVFKKL